MAWLPSYACEDDPNVERKRAARALARFMKLHPHNIAQKTEVMVEHFQAVKRAKTIGLPEVLRARTVVVRLTLAGAEIPADAKGAAGREGAEQRELPEVTNVSRVAILHRASADHVRAGCVNARAAAGALSAEVEWQPP